MGRRHEAIDPVAADAQPKTFPTGSPIGTEYFQDPPTQQLIRYLLEDIGAPQGPTRVCEDNRATRIIEQNPGILRTPQAAQAGT
jgi:hypothetical protein